VSLKTGTGHEGFNEADRKFGENAGGGSEDVIVIPTKAHELDVSHFIFEFITMLIPLRNVHEDDEEETKAPAIRSVEILRNIKFTRRKTD